MLRHPSRPKPAPRKAFHRNYVELILRPASNLLVAGLLVLEEHSMFRARPGSLRKLVPGFIIGLICSLACVAAAQINGVPASVTSIGFGGRDNGIPGTPASVTPSAQTDRQLSRSLQLPTWIFERPEYSNFPAPSRSRRVLPYRCALLHACVHPRHCGAATGGRGCG